MQGPVSEVGGRGIRNPDAGVREGGEYVAGQDYKSRPSAPRPLGRAAYSVRRRSVAADRAADAQGVGAHVPRFWEGMCGGAAVGGLRVRSGGWPTRR